MNKRQTVAFHTLGCKLNFAETSSIARQLKESGYQKVDFAHAADVYVINTCSVTENADRECKLHVNRALQNNPDGFVIVIGCYAQLKPHTIASIPGVSLVLGATEKFNVAHHLQNLEEKQQAQVFACDISDSHIFTSSYSSGDRTRVFLKVQDGCDYSCTFCTIPLARGNSRSDTIDNVLNQTRKIIAGGAKEIVLTGVNLGDFGKAHPNNNHSSTFSHLVKALEGQEGNVRYRISSIEPNLLTDEVIAQVSTSRKFMPHFHIPLQSGSDKILKRMRRRYLSELYELRVRSIKSIMPHACIGADVITGFPGETEEDFIQTYDFLNKLDVSYLHVFTYSERENTLAHEMNEAVPIPIRKRRTRMLRILSEKKLRHFYTQQAHKEMNVLFENENKNGFMFGYSENYVRIKTRFNPALINSIERCKAGIPDENNEVPCEIFSFEPVF